MIEANRTERSKAPSALISKMKKSEFCKNVIYDLIVFDPRFFTIQPNFISKSAFLLAHTDSFVKFQLLAIEKSPIFWAHADSSKP